MITTHAWTATMMATSYAVLFALLALCSCRPEPLALSPQFTDHAPTPCCSDTIHDLYAASVRVPHQ